MASVSGELLGPFPLLLSVEEFARLDDIAGGGVQLENALIEIVSGRVLADFALDLDLPVRITLGDHFEFADVDDAFTGRRRRLVVWRSRRQRGLRDVDCRNGHRSLVCLLGSGGETCQNDRDGPRRSQKNLVNFHRNASW